jgi:hypothetical protein
MEFLIMAESWDRAVITLRIAITEEHLLAQVLELEASEVETFMDQELQIAYLTILKTLEDL